MKERPILFSAPMVRAILDGRKTQTRRIVKGDVVEGAVASGCKYGTVGDRLWVKETHKPHCDAKLGTCVKYRADGAVLKPTTWTHAQGGVWELNEQNPNWKPSIFMPRFASRITLEIVAVSVERLHDITENDAIAEGCEMDGVFPKEQPDVSGVGRRGWDSAVEWYSDLWETINGEGSWDKNPFVWCITFKKL